MLRREMNVRAMQKAAVAHTPHAQLSAYTGTRENLAPIAEREIRSEPIRSTSFRFVSRTERRRRVTVIFGTLKHRDKLALCKISEPGLMVLP